jgi:Protein of unknown function (DUF4058)
MPSPFPGMDPFLEDAEFFPDLHDSLIVHLKESIQAKLPAKYYAITGNRIWLDVARPPVGPDVRIHEKNNGEESTSGGGTSVLTKPLANPVLITIPKDEFRETFVDIYAVQEHGRRLVTSIEVLSPTNKAPRERGHKLFRRKQRELLRNKVHLVEIDLLRAGKHSTTAPLRYVRAKTGAFDYHVCVHRSDRAEDFFIYPVQLADPLPSIAIPLDSGDADVEISLQGLFAAIYDSARYAKMLNYHRPIPPPALIPEKVEWIMKLLTEKGIRS